jgi:hypothetical protein
VTGHKLPRKKQNTLPDVQGLDLAYVSCARKKQNTLPDVQGLDLAYVSCAAGPARPDGKLGRNKTLFPMSKGLIWLMFHALQVRQGPMEN